MLNGFRFTIRLQNENSVLQSEEKAAEKKEVEKRKEHSTELIVISTVHNCNA